MNPVITPDIQAKIAIFRQKCADDTITIEELKEALALMREGRLAAARTSDSAKRTKAKATILNADEMLKELGEI